MFRLITFCSPLQGQNNIMALGRAIFLLVCGAIALSIEGALTHVDNFSPLFVYGFDINSRSVLMFVRDGLLSEYARFI